MKLLESIKLAMQVFPNSFINRNNEVILIPKFNVYIQLDDVKTNEDFKVKLCEWLSRDCSCALRYSQDKMKLFLTPLWALVDVELLVNSLIENLLVVRLMKIILI